MVDIQKITNLAEKYNWTFLIHQEKNLMLSYTKLIDGFLSRINVYYHKRYPFFTVATVVKHPLKGKNQLYRRDVSLKFLERIFENPRVHTHSSWNCRGYHFRNQL